MTLIGILGEPATGKTSLMRAILERLPSDYTRFKYGLLRGRQYPGELYVLGIYHENELFAGTDRLSMAVQPDAIKFLQRCVAPHGVVIFEGDRLTREGFLMAVPYDSLKLFLLVATEEEKARRHKARHDSQPVQFHRSRRTLIDRLNQRFTMQELRNQRVSDLRANAARIYAAIGAPAPPRA